MSIYNRLWYSSQPHFPNRCLINFLRPLSWGYRAAVTLRKYFYRWGWKQSVRFPVPVIVVGNITVGGTGKTPLTIRLVNELQQNGWRPGIVSRGYGGNAIHSPQPVFADSDPRRVGDEAVLMAQKTAAPVMVCGNRVKAVSALLRQYHCNIVVSDDGLQHLALKRDMEIVVLDGERRLGNRLCLPAGPLRESARRLKTIDFQVTNGQARSGEWSMQLTPEAIYSLRDTSRQLTVNDLNGEAIHAIAGIGNPQRFFNTLIRLGFNIIPHAFPDHHVFCPQDLDFGDNRMIIMTEKDAVKCRTFAHELLWCLPVHAELPAEFFIALQEKLQPIP